MYGSLDFENFADDINTNGYGYAITWGNEWYDTQNDNEYRHYIIEYGPVTTSELASTVDLVIADASTASSSDYTLSSGTVTIPAGSMSATLTIPVTNDTTLEAQEEIRLTLSNVQNAVLGRSSVSAFITDGEEILANTTQKAILADNIFKDSRNSLFE